MADLQISPVKRIQGEFGVGGDKSISHRGLMLASLAKGVSTLSNLSASQDCSRTLEAFRKLGVKINSLKKGQYRIYGRGVNGLTAPAAELYLGNSGTTMRLLAGILSAQGFRCILTGDRSLNSRPMQRIIEPLTKMGARIRASRENNFAPLIIDKSKTLRPIEYVMSIPSAQVKSAILLAGIQTQGTTRVIEPYKSRDHTERMLRQFGAKIQAKGLAVAVKGKSTLSPQELFIPGDISSAAFLITAAAILPGSEITLKSVGLNPTRCGFLRVLSRMGAKLEVKYQRPEMDNPAYPAEPYGDIICVHSPLKATIINKSEIAQLIDEVPILMVAAAYARGRTVICGAGELRVKETDRITSMLTNLKAMGAGVCAQGENIIVEGGGRLLGAEVESFSDHRTALSMIIAALAAQGKTKIKDVECIKTSFPEFPRLLKDKILI